MRVVIITLDGHLASAVQQARAELKRDLPQVSLRLHAASDWADDPDSLERCRQDIEQGDIVFANMLFMDDHIQAVLPWLQARRPDCDAMIGCIAAAEVIKLTRMGRFAMDGKQSGITALLKRLRGSKKPGASSGEKQVAMLKRLPKILKFIPGTAQDVRAYFLTMQYWLAGSSANIANLVRFLIDRYADGERLAYRGAVRVAEPLVYPETGVYHPRLAGRIGEDSGALPEPDKVRGRVGLLVMRAYVLAGDTAHYDAMIAALEARGLAVVPAFASGLDARPAVRKFFQQDGEASVDAVLSLTCFSLVGGPAFNDAKAAETMLAELDVPYLAAQAVEFQNIEQWQSSSRGLMPVEATMMIAIPELDGATGPMVYGGREAEARGDGVRHMRPATDRVDMLASRIDKLVSLRAKARAERNLAIVLFNFPPNAGGTGTAAFLSVFESLFNVLKRLDREGYDVEVPASVDALRTKVLSGNAERFGTDANVHARIPVDDHVRRERHLAEIEAQWGPAPGRVLTDGSAIQVLGAQFGKVFVGIQPGFGYEGDPMRLLFEQGFAPTHAFSAFYRWLREDYDADAVVHFGTHGALEFMPGKQVGLSGACWPDRLIGDLPNVYLYAANNPSEGTIAKRRAAATLVSYLTPPLSQAGLYRGLLDLKGSLDRYRALEPHADNERAALVELIQAQAASLDLCPAEPAWADTGPGEIAQLNDAVLELEYALIPDGLHVIGEALSDAQRLDHMKVMAEPLGAGDEDDTVLQALIAGAPVNEILGQGRKLDAARKERLEKLAHFDRLLCADHERDGLIHALDGGFIRPAPGGDLLRTPDVLPTGRNSHGFDPFRIPSAYAVKDGAAQAERLIERHIADGHRLPETIALVLWGTDNLKTEGGPIGQALALIGAKPRFDSYGRLSGADLIPLEDLGRPRIDVVITVSGIFRDLLPLQTRLLAEACLRAAEAKEPYSQNYIAKHARHYAEINGCTIGEAALRVFSNDDGAYGSNVNHLIDSGCWQDEDELAETYTRRKCFAYGVDGKPVRQPALLQSVLSQVELTYQNLESVELGVTTIDHYVDTLGGIGRAVQRARDEAVPVYIGDQTRSDGVVRTLAEQVALETRTRALNPKWYEGMLKHGYEGVRQIEAHVTNTMGWSATTGQVAPWVYQQLTQTFVLDETMRERLAELNPKASARVANRLLEAHERNYWQPDDSVLDALRRAGEDLEDRLEGITEGVAA